MGALLGLGLLFGALGLAFRRPARAEPAGMIGMPILRITSGVHILTITRHPQGYAWYVARGSDVLESSNEGSNAGAVAVGMESLQGYIAADASIRVARLEAPEIVGDVRKLGEQWVWSVLSSPPRTGQSTSRPEAVMELLGALQLEGAADAPPLPKPMRLKHGVEINVDCTEMRVHDLGTWVASAGPVVVDAIEADIVDATELADAVLENVIACNTDDLVIDGRAWSPLETQVMLDQVLAGQYDDPVAPEDKLAALIVGRTLTATVGLEGPASAPLEEAEPETVTLEEE